MEAEVPRNGGTRSHCGPVPRVVYGARSQRPKKTPRRTSGVKPVEGPGGRQCNRCGERVSVKAAGQQPEGRFGRMGTTPDTRKVLAEPSVAVRVVRLKRTWSLSRTTAVSVG